MRTVFGGELVPTWELKAPGGAGTRTRRRPHSARIPTFSLTKTRPSYSLHRPHDLDTPALLREYRWINITVLARPRSPPLSPLQPDPARSSQLAACYGGGGGGALLALGWNWAALPPVNCQQLRRRLCSRARLARARSLAATLAARVSLLTPCYTGYLSRGIMKFQARGVTVVPPHEWSAPVPWWPVCQQPHPARLAQAL